MTANYVRKLFADLVRLKSVKQCVPQWLFVFLFASCTLFALCLLLMRSLSGFFRSPAGRHSSALFLVALKSHVSQACFKPSASCSWCASRAEPAFEDLKRLYSRKTFSLWEASSLWTVRASEQAVQTAIAVDNHRKPLRELWLRELRRRELRPRELRPRRCCSFGISSCEVQRLCVLDTRLIELNTLSSLYVTRLGIGLFDDLACYRW